MMWGGAISKLLLLRILVVAVLFVIMLIGVTLRCKKMEIVDIAVAVFYEMMELVNQCYTRWHSYSYVARLYQSIMLLLLA